MCKGVKEHNTTLANVDPDENEKYTLKDMWNCIKTNKYLMLLLLSTVITACLQTGGAVGLLVSYYHFGSSLIMAIPIAIAFIPQTIAQMSARRRVDSSSLFWNCELMFSDISVFISQLSWIYNRMLMIRVATDTSREPDDTKMLVILRALSSVVDWRARILLGST